MKKSTILALLTFLTANVFAQDKLKNIQEGSSWAPANIKVDGNLPEWNDTFHAYNKSTKIYYTLANDDRFLYLTIKSTDATNNAKIQAGGITFTLNTAGKKKDEGSYIITYPVINRAARGQRGAGGGRGGFGGGGFGGFGGGTRGAVSDSASKAAADAAHKQFIASSKTINAIGFKDITDTVISIYNEYSIKAAIGFNNEGAFTYELALPLKALELTPGSNKELAYNVKLNGIQIPNRPENPNEGGGGGFGGAGGRGGNGGGGGNRGGGGGGNAGGGGTRGGRGGDTPGGINFAELIAPTDFWGKYVLAQKVSTIAKP